ncbi:MAG: type II restriction endonuclease [Nanoarchaeota archaeon]|nr:type II restriction endonuclease [Nanoarchaeota archaeon]
MLKSREIKREDFVEEFLNSIIPGMIKRDDFINWQRIRDELNLTKMEVDFVQDLINQDNPYTYLRDSLLSSDVPGKIISICFRLLAHTPDNFITWEDKINLKKLALNIDDEEEMNKFLDALKGVGFDNVIQSKNLNEFYKGILIGLETHKRKNSGGSAYVDFVRNKLKLIVNNLNKKNFNLRLVEEENIPYGGDSRQAKRVDFAILRNGKIIIGIEVNFYTNTGSKPTEIKRSYGEVNRKLNSNGIELIWLTDGFGYTIMKKSLGDAFEIHPNTYNSRMMEMFLEDDLENFLNK